MLQSRAIKLISDQILASKLVLGLYLSGPLVINPEDASGDIHLHLVVEESKYDIVCEQREKFLEAYYSILYINEDHHTSIVHCVYDNGVIAYLYVIKEIEVKQLLGVKVIFDGTNSLLTNMLVHNPNQEIAEKINSFAFTLVKYYSYLRSDDFLNMLHEASRLAIGLKDLLVFLTSMTKNTDEAEKLLYIESNEKKHQQAIKHLDINNSLMAVKLMMNIFDGIINDMTIALAQMVNIDLYLFAKERIWKL